MSGSRRAAWAALAGFGIVLLLLALTGIPAAADRWILDALRRAGQPAVADMPAGLVIVAARLSRLGAGWVRAAIAMAGAIGLAMTRRPRGALVLLAAWAIGAVVAEEAKHLIGRPRPPLAFHLVPVHQSSFPSGHAAGAMLLFPLLGWLAGGRAGARAGVMLALLVGLTRILLGVHWTSDVIGGWLLGGAVALFAASLMDGRRHR